MKHSFVCSYSSSSVSCRNRSHERSVYDIMNSQGSQAIKIFPPAYAPFIGYMDPRGEASGINVLTLPQGPAAGSIKT